MSIPLAHFIDRLAHLLPGETLNTPWYITDNLSMIIESMIPSCGNDYQICDGIAVHRTAVIEQHVVLKGPVIISEGVTVGANAYIRGPVLLDRNVHIGAGCEIKQSAIFASTAIAHFNYIGNSLIGSHVNFEAGSIAANHYNERENKIISVLHKDDVINTGVKKFGALVGDGSKIGANAVLSPGTILKKNSVVGRLELVEQLKS